MPYLPWLNTSPLIDFAIQKGRGVAGAVSGQPYDVYRLTSATNVGVISGAPLFAGYPALVKKTTSKKIIENTAFDLQVYEAKVDNLALVKGDVFLQRGPDNDGSIFTYAQSRLTQATLFVRTEANIFISRPATRAGSSTQQEAGQVVVQTQRAGTYKGIERVLQLNSGFYALSNLDQQGVTPANVAAGLQPLNRVRDAREPKLPTTLYREHFLAYLPLMPGFQPIELDRLNFPNMDRYEIALVYTSEQTGLSGYICIVEKLAT